MAKNTSVNVRTTEDVKKGAEVILNGLGLNISSAVNLFLKQVINYRGIPFDLRLPRKRYMLWMTLKIVVILSQQIPLKKCLKRLAYEFQKTDMDKKIFQGCQACEKA